MAKKVSFTVQSSEKVEPYQWLADNAATTRSMPENARSKLAEIMNA